MNREEPIQTSERTNLVEHLESYGIRHFDTEEYWEWGGKVLGPKTGKKLDRYRRPLVDGDATEGQLTRFYDFIASPKIAAVVHSAKADAIRASGSILESYLNPATRILDLGCSIGYLTTFYARSETTREVVGWDRSARSISVATRLAESLGVSNVRFECGDIITDLIDWHPEIALSSQAIGNTPATDAILERLQETLPSNGALISIEALDSSLSSVRSHRE